MYDYTGFMITEDADQPKQTNEPQTNEIGTPKSVRYILSIDGGGSRGIFPLEILNHLRLMNYDLNKFDLIVGTSAGAIIAGCFGMNVSMDTIQSAFTQDNLLKIFPPHNKVLASVEPRPIYYDTKREQVIQELIGASTTFEDVKKNICLVSWNLSQNQPVLFQNPECSHIKLSDAIMASSAAPIYFPAVSVNNAWFIDGGVASNNPIMIAFMEARRKWPNDIIKILSLGTGQVKLVETSVDKRLNGGLMQWMENGLIDLLVDAPNKMMMHELMLKHLDNTTVLRLDTTITSSLTLDCTDISLLNELKKSAKQTIDQNVDQIKQFFAP